MRRLLLILVPFALFLIAWFAAGLARGPGYILNSPQSAIGQSTELDLQMIAPEARVSDLKVVLEQNGVGYTVFDAERSGLGMLEVEGDTVRFRHRVGRAYTPELVEGPARLTVTISRPVFMGLRQVSSTLSADLEVRLTPPRVTVLSTHHYINLGGSEMVVYRVSPTATSSGVRVGDQEYRGFRAVNAGVTSADSLTYVSFFAVLWNQTAADPISVYARDAVGNEATAALEHRVFPKVFRKSRIVVDDQFLRRVVPAILSNSPNFRVADPGDLLQSYLQINREMRRQNDSLIASLALRTDTTMHWNGPFRQLSNTAVEAGFADQRTYVYNGDSIDYQTHLGFDLASTAAAPVLAANSGTVVHAGWLGIYGDCVILDHGMGVQSLYAHLSSMDVAVGDVVQMNDRLGRSGVTGLAGGDHLHFTMLLHGRAVNAIDWWSRQWIEDRILRKLREAGSDSR